MKNIAPLLIAVGLVFGPGYFYFYEYLSGEAAETHVLSERAGRWELPDGAIVRLRSGLAYKPVSLELTPASNRHRLRFTFDVKSRDDVPSGIHNSYQASLLQGDTTIFERSIEIKDTGQVTKTLDPFEIFFPGTYFLLLEEIGTPPLGVTSVKFELLNRAEKPRMWLAWSGLVLLGFGVVLVLRDFLGKALKR
ncbi:MAG TPA: hypothetical protein VIU02_08625 [Burkholderiales bacterium]